MSNLREAAQQALEALEDYAQYGATERAKTAITALRTALAEPEHEDWCASVTQMLACDPPRPAPCNCKRTEEFVCSTGLCRYRRPLTEMEIVELMSSHIPADYDGPLIEFARAIEAAHGIKQEEA